MKKISLLIFISVTQCLHAQNLVPNPSFEDENICEYHQSCSPSAWFYATKNLVAGYFENQIPAATGKHWLSLVAGNRLNTGGRQYWETMLLHPLDKGKTYRVSVSVHGWDSGPNPNDIGMHFIQGMIFYDTDTVIQPGIYLNFSDAKVKEQKKGWFRLEKEFIAQGDEQCMMMGNFSGDNYQEVAQKRHSSSVYIGLLADDIEIVPVEKLDCENCQHIKDSLYAIVNRHSAASIVSAPNSQQTISPAEKLPDTLVLNDIYFSFSSFIISNPDSLEHYRRDFESAPIKKIKIIGYTDDAGTAGVNKKLSLQRAQEVAKLISTKFSIPNANIDAEGYGISTDNKDKSKNRRVEIYIYRQ